MTFRRVGAAFLASSLCGLGLSGCADPVVDGSAPTSWDSRIKQYADFVATTYGEAWKQPVKVRFLDDQRFDRITGIGGGAGADPNAPLPWQDRSLGIQTPPTDDPFGDGSDGTELLGLYQPSSRSLLVRGSKVTSANAFVVLHELTHALQAQYLPQPEPSTNGDRELATVAVVEGDANSVAARWAASHPDDADPETDGSETDGSETDGAGADGAGADGAGADGAGADGAAPGAAALDTFTGIPALNWWRTLMPYSTGWHFIETALHAGGPARRRHLLQLAVERRLTTLDVMTLRVDTDGSPPPPPASVTTVTSAPDISADDTGPIGAARWYAILIGLGKDARAALGGLTAESSTWSPADGTYLGNCFAAQLSGQPDGLNAFLAALGDWMISTNATVDDIDASTKEMSWCGPGPEVSPTLRQYVAALSADSEAAAGLVRAET